MSGESAGGVDQFIPQCGHSAPWVPHPANVPEYRREYQSPVMDPRQRRASQPCKQSQGGQVRGYPSHAHQSNIDQVNLSSTQGQINLMYENCSAASVSPAVSPGWAESALPCQSSCASGLAADTLTDAANTNSDRVPPVEPVSLPETLSYNGTGSWEAFCNKFEMFVDYHKLSEEDKQYYLCMALEGEASMYMALVRKLNRKLTYSEFMHKLQKRFGFSDEPQVVRMQFASAQQHVDEDAFKWADRLMTMASRAFGGLPDSYVQEELVARFCQGASDKEAGRHVLTSWPKTLDLAIQQYKWYQFTCKSMHMGIDSTCSSLSNVRRLPEETETNAKIQKLMPKVKST